MASINLKHTSGNGTILNSPAANPSSDITLKLPSTTGSAGQVLQVASANHSATNAELEFAAAASAGGASNVSFNSGNGIDFSATSDASGMASELLDDYEEGTWRPVLARSSGTTQSTYVNRYGSYTKVGRVVHAVVNFYTTSGIGGSGNYHLNGLPFTPDTSGTGSILSSCSFRFSRLYLNNGDFAGGDNENTFELVSGQSYARLRNIDNNSLITSLSGNTFIVNGQITYFATT